MEKAYLTQYEIDCFELTFSELRIKYPLILDQQIQNDQVEIKKVLCEFNQWRFLKFIKINPWLIYDFKNLKF